MFLLPSHSPKTASSRRRAAFSQLQEATADLETPYAVVDLLALRTNAADMVRRSSGKQIRVASKSIRCRAILDEVLAMPGMHGVLAYTLPEALWLAADATGRPGVEDVVVGYPTVDRVALRQLASDETLASRITLMIDSVDHLDHLESVVGPDGPHLRICLDLDASLRLARGRLHLGARRSPLHSPDQAAALARAVVSHPRFRLVGLMAYEGQIAGMGDDQPGPLHSKLSIRAMQTLSIRELRDRRGAAVAAVREVAPLEFVNGGGTGSLETTSSEDAVTEVAAGSGFFAPMLFDGYTRFTLEPAAYFVLSVVRRPSPAHATVLGGGWIASGAAGADRLPTPVWPEGLSLLPAEGAGEVQTPLTGEPVGRLRVGDRVWFRHTKAGELSEHVDGLHLVENGQVTATVPTYRGEGKAFL